MAQQFSGSLQITNGQWDKYSLLLWIEEKSYSVENNTSVVEWWVGIRSNTAYHSHYGITETYTVVINGSTVHNANHAPTVNAGQTVWVASGTTTVSHNADGSKSISASASFSCSDTFQYSPRTGSCSGNLTLTTIPRATTPSVDKPSLDCGSVIKITGTSASSSFSHKLYSLWNGTEKLIATLDKGSTAVSYSYTIPTSWESDIPNATSAIATFILETLNGSTVIGRKTINATVKVRSGVLPMIGNPTLEDTNTICHTMGMYVQSQSRIKFTIPTSGNQGSTITSISTKIDGQTYNSDTFTTRVIQNSGNLSYTITVTDSRGRTATKSGSINVVAYNPPSLTNVSAKRANSSYAVDEVSGTYALLHFKVGFTSLSNKNVTSFYIQYRASGASSWTKINSWANNYTLNQDYKADNRFTSTTATYEVAFGVKDKFMSDYSWQIVTVTPTYTLINFGKDGKSLTFFGQDVNTPNVLTINGDLAINSIKENTSSTKLLVANGSTVTYRDWNKLIKTIKDAVDTLTTKVTSILNGTSNVMLKYDSGWVDLKKLTNNSHACYREKNGFCTVSINVWNGGAPIGPAKEYLFGTLPPSCWPAKEMTVAGTPKANTGYEIQLNVKPNGNVTIYNSSPNSTILHYGVSMTFPV